VDALGGADVEDRDDVAVVQPGGAAGLAAEARQANRVAVGGQHLQRDVAVELYTTASLLVVLSRLRASS
jgi:hypothetical protein